MTIERSSAKKIITLKLELDTVLIFGNANTAKEENNSFLKEVGTYNTRLRLLDMCVTLTATEVYTQVSPMSLRRSFHRVID